eukprot:1159061-Pelagomonas_calceolata.AAC.15
MFCARTCVIGPALEVDRRFSVYPLKFYSGTQMISRGAGGSRDRQARTITLNDTFNATPNDTFNATPNDTSHQMTHQTAGHLLLRQHALA